MPIDDATRFEQLHDHYKETFSCVQSAIAQRDRFFLTTLGSAVLLVFRALSPQATAQNIAAFLTTKFEFPQVDVSVFGSALWFVLLYSTIRYLQFTVQVERRYPYLHAIENILSEAYAGGIAFTREGKAYLDKYPKFSKWVSFLYGLAFPALLLFAVLISMALDLSRELLPAARIFNLFIGLMLVTSVGLYLLLHWEKKRAEKPTPSTNRRTKNHG